MRAQLLQLAGVRLVDAPQAGEIATTLPTAAIYLPSADHLKEYRAISAPLAEAEIANLADHDLAAAYLAVSSLADFMEQITRPGATFSTPYLDCRNLWGHPRQARCSQPREPRQGLCRDARWLGSRHRSARLR
jgi:hypothetical protein